MHYAEAKGLLSATKGMNLYRGCTHGCIYCDSRSRCYQMDHDFEDVEVKANAPALLETALRKKRAKCVIGTGSMCDPYMPVIDGKPHPNTRICLELIDRYGFGLAIQTKSDVILNDLDMLKSIHRKAGCTVQTTLTTYDEDLCRIVEPDVCTTQARFTMLMKMKEAGIPTVVWISPLLPFINDTRENLTGILGYCVEAGVRGIIWFGAGMTLRDGNREYYYKKLDEHFPGLSKKYHTKYGYAYEIPSDRSDELNRLLQETCDKHGLKCDPGAVFASLREMPGRIETEQIRLF